MPSPSTHQDSPCKRCGGEGLTVRSLAATAPLVPCPDCTQDSPKVPERPWPRVILRRWEHRSPGEITSYSVLPAGREQPPEPRQREAETYIPVSALLSDEVVEAIKKARQERGAGPGLDSWIRADLQAAIEQVGGGQGGG